MKGPVQFPQTPITEETFKKQGWKKEYDSDDGRDEVYQYTLNLPKQSRDPYGLQLISTTNKDKIRGIDITISIKSQKKEHSFELLKQLNFPFKEKRSN